MLGITRLHNLDLAAGYVQRSIAAFPREQREAAVLRELLAQLGVGVDPLGLPRALPMHLLDYVALATVAVTGCGRGAGVPRWGMFQAAFASTASNIASSSSIEAASRYLAAQS